MLPVDKGDKEEKKKPLAKAHPLPHDWHQLALQNCWLKTSYNCMCVYIHMFSSHPICIWRNKLFQVGLVPKSSGIKYMVDANNGHPNIVSNINYWIFGKTTYSTMIGGSRKNAKAHPFRLEICQKIYMIEFMGQKFYTLKVRKLRIFLLKKKQQKCIYITYFSRFLLKFNWVCEILVVSVQNHTWWNK